jgi:hypothetical protein
LPFCVSLVELGVKGLHHHCFASKTFHLLAPEKILLLRLDCCGLILWAVDLDGHCWLFDSMIGIIQVFVELQFQI